MPGRILIVDDIPTSRLLTRAKLTNAWYDVIEAANGLQALDIAMAEQPDMILLDVMMPGIDGFETCRRLKAAPETSHIPVVMLTALDERSDRMRGLDAGADDFLTKPFNDAALLSRTNSLTRMKMMIDELRLRAQTARGIGLDTPCDTMPDFAKAAILLINADPDLTERTVSEMRHHLGCEVGVAAGQAEARTLMHTHAYDAFLIGAEPADGNPMRIASMLRGRPSTRQAALMMMFRPGDVVNPPLAMEMGVSDYLTLPADYAEMAARLRVQLRRKHYSDQLRKTAQDSVALAAIDPLTGLYNRRYTDAHIAGLIQRNGSEAGRLAAMVIDLDDFKTINDRHGHAAGDSVLCEFARRLRATVRGVDLVSRIGGEEFLVVMPDIQPTHAARIAERLRAAVERPAFDIDCGARQLALTVSIGLALHVDGETGAELIARADRAVYRSKAAGRNIVTLDAA